VQVTLSQRLNKFELNLWFEQFGLEESETWIVMKRGTPAQIAEWLERVVPMSPDPPLINAVLTELNRQIPDGVL
jgi:hypothetical protein